MNKGIIFLSGALVGSIFTYLFMKKNMEDKIDEEIRKYREDFKKKREKGIVKDDPNAVKEDGSIKEETASYREYEEKGEANYTQYGSFFNSSGASINLSKSVTREVESSEGDEESREINEENKEDSDEIREVNEDGTVNVILIPNDDVTLSDYEERAESSEAIYYNQDEGKFYKFKNDEDTEASEFVMPFDVRKEVLDFSSEFTKYLWDPSSKTIYTIIPIESRR